jgi:hypothetical protein
MGISRREFFENSPAGVRNWRLRAQLDVRGEENFAFLRDSWFFFHRARRGGGVSEGAGGVEHSEGGEGDSDEGDLHVTSLFRT